MIREFLSHALRPRLGFLGVGWIGRHRLAAVAESGLAEITAVADPSRAAAEQAAALAPGAETLDSLEAVLATEPDGLVIATPSAAHAEQAIAALERGVAVFCQKPLARTAAETERVLAAARRADRLLGVDMSYRHVRGVNAIREAIANRELGEVFAADLTFHNAYGPDKLWFYDIALAGGGCAMDLGIHLVDLALWVLDYPPLQGLSSRLYSQGRLLPEPVNRAEDYAVAQLDLATGTHVRLACSWRLAAGRDAVIEAAFYGTEGAMALRNVEGSFYDFVVERYRGTACERLAEPPDAWGGRALLAWVRQLADDPRFDPDIERTAEVAQVLDAIYGRR